MLSASAAKNPNMAYDLVSILIYVLLTNIVVYVILRYYTKESRMKWGLYIPLFVTYVILLSSLPLISVDLAAGLYAKDTADPQDNEPAKYFVVLWNIVYWSIQFLAWLIIPVCMSYVYTGEFTLLTRILDSILQNVIMYGIMLLVGGLALIGLVVYLIVNKRGLDFKMIVGIGQSLSNSYGLLLLISLLGYGVVDLPRYLWRQANLERSLQYCEFQASKMFDTVDEIEHNMKQKLMQVRSLDMQFKDRPLDDPLRGFVEQMVGNCEKELAKCQIGAADRSDEDITRRKLAKIHRDVLYAISEYHRSEYQWQALQDQAFFLEDVINSINGQDKKISSQFRKERTGVWAKLFDLPEWFYYKYFRGFMYRFLAIACIPFALILIYSQFTPLVASVMPKDPKKQTDISVISLLIRSMSHADGWARILMQMTSLIVVVIMAFTALFALFRMEIYSIYQLIPHHSDTYSVLYTAIFLCRVVPTLCFNFLQIANVRETDGVAYYRVMGVMRVDGLKNLVGKDYVGYLEILGGGFANYFPMVMVIITAITLFNVVGYLGALCNVKRFNFNDKIIDEDVEEGRSILQRERRRRISSMNLNERLRDDDESFGISSNIERELQLQVVDEEDFDTPVPKKKSASDRVKDLFSKYKKERPSVKKDKSSPKFSYRDEFDE